jgi:integration host factor subunit beta
LGGLLQKLEVIKSKLIQRILAQNPHRRQNDVEKIVECSMRLLPQWHAANRVELRGFGAFSVRKRAARTGRNPRTGAYVSVEEKSVPYFKTGKEMRERLNPTSQ